MRRYDVERTVTTKAGPVTYARPYHDCETCGQGFFPRDEELGLDEDLTDDLQAEALDLALNGPFEAAAERLELHHGVKLSETGLKHLFERKSAPLADAEKPHPSIPLPLTEFNAHRPVVIQNDGSMIRRTDGWHEVKLLRVQTLQETTSVYVAEARARLRLEETLSKLGRSPERSGNKYRTMVVLPWKGYRTLPHSPSSIEKCIKRDDTGKTPRKRFHSESSCTLHKSMDSIETCCTANAA